MEEVLARLVSLIKDDQPLHDAIVRLIDASTDSQKARAELARSRIRAKPKG